VNIMGYIAKSNNSYGVDPHIWSTLKNSLYTGAKDESIKMVLDYCKAGKLDPLQKPVHIVPMSVKNAQTGKYEFRDTIMPGIGLYRIQAARSNQYAGVSEPEYGEDIEATLDGVKITYPKWCKVTVKKIVHGVVVEFSAKEYWLENYAVKGRDSVAPNAMWYKRPYGQLAKCAEAQALRKAFPEFVSQQPTAEEMEGKTLNELNNEFKNITPKPTAISKLDKFLEQEEVKPAEEGLRVQLSSLIVSRHIPQETVQKWCEAGGVDSLNELDDAKIKSCIEYVESKGMVNSHRCLNSGE
jgi:phage recombination protein Bet